MERGTVRTSSAQDTEGATRGAGAAPVIARSFDISSCTMRSKSSDMVAGCGTAAVRTRHQDSRPTVVLVTRLKRRVPDSAESRTRSHHIGLTGCGKRLISVPVTQALASKVPRSAPLAASSILD